MAFICVKGKVYHKKGEARMSPRYPTISIITKHMVQASPAYLLIRNQLFSFTWVHRPTFSLHDRIFSHYRDNIHGLRLAAANFSHSHGFTAQLSHSTQLLHSTIEFSLIIMIIFMDCDWLLPEFYGGKEYK